MGNTENKNIDMQIIPDKENLTESEARKVTGGSFIDDIINFFGKSEEDDAVKAISPNIGDPGNGDYFK